MTAAECAPRCIRKVDEATLDYNVKKLPPSKKQRNSVSYRAQGNRTRESPLVTVLKVSHLTQSHPLKGEAQPVA